MKQGIILTLLFAFATASFGQKTDQKKSSKIDYLNKSKRQKKAALILLGGGAASVITGFAIPEGKQTDFNYYSFSYNNKNSGVKGAFIIAGALSMLGSIPLFISSNRNKRKAINITAYFKMEKMQVIQQAILYSRPLPALNVSIDL